MRASTLLAPLLVLGGSLAFAMTPAETDLAAGAVDQKQAGQLVERLCQEDLGGRPCGTPACAAAAEQIRDAFKSAGLEAEVQTAADLPHVIAIIKGSEKPDEAILVSSHFDGPGVMQGKQIPAADESASGTAALIEVARGLTKAKPRRTVILAAFSGYWDEDDAKRYRGSRAWAEEAKKKWKLVYHVDLAMVGVGLFPKEPGRFFALGDESGEGAAAAIEAAAKAETALKITRTSVYLIEGRGPRDDYHTMQGLEIPFVFVTAGVSKFYHKPEDTPATVDPVRVANAARFAVRIVAQIDALAAAPAFRKDPPTDDMNDAKETLALIEAALEPGSGLDMTKSSREAMTWKRDKVKEMIERGELTKKDRAELQRALESLLYVLIK
jgi:hypothetical protein